MQMIQIQLLVIQLHLLMIHLQLHALLHTTSAGSMFVLCLFFLKQLIPKNLPFAAAESPFETTIIFSKQHIANIFEKIHAKYNMKKNELKKIIEYNLPLANGKMKTLYIENDDDKIENLTSFYCKMEELNTYPLIIHKRKKDAKRDNRPIEKVYQALMVNFFSADLNFYQMFVDHLDIAERFKSTRDYISLIMGEKCLNLVSPAHFYCHIKGCDTLIVLGYFSKLSLVIRHWDGHAVLEHDEGPGSDLARRYRYVEKEKGGKKWLLISDFQSRLEELNASIYNGKKLTITEGSYNFIGKDSKFNGRSFLIDENILEAILNCDHLALANLPKPKPPVGMKSYFAVTSSSFSSSSKNSASVVKSSQKASPVVTTVTTSSSSSKNS